MGLVCLSLITTGRAYSQQGLVFKDMAEATPNIPCAWCPTPKTQGWVVSTGGNQDINNMTAQNYIQVVGAGSGNPTPRQGSYSYKFYMERRPDLFGGPNNDLQGQLQHCRNE